VLLHFGAVNWECAVAVNGRVVGRHRGGYTAFEFDISDALREGANELTVAVINPLKVDQPDAQVTGKQRRESKGIFYTGATGIWQTVWLEPVPARHIEGLKLIPDIDAGVLRVTVQGDAAADAAITAFDGQSAVAQANAKCGAAIDLPIPNAHRWSPVDPHLYNLTVTLSDHGAALDTVGSYFAMRKVSLGKDARGRTRIFLNNDFLPQIGLLDQGYWPDGIYTAPTDDALKFDIETAKRLGYNLLRKHAKVEPQRWYYWADRLGMLVWQDMPQAFSTSYSDAGRQQWLAEWRAEILELFNDPSIIVWTPFNEGWGQHDTEAIVAFTRQLDPTRLINNASGWNDCHVGDLSDAHAYPGPWSANAEPARAVVNGEFGGITEVITGHTWTGAHTYGYGDILHDYPWLATKRYAGLLQTAYRLSGDRGTSAFVYTQLTDVEQELNGILTYDRKVIKFDPAILAAANRGQFPRLPPDPNATPGGKN
jgi:beta-galactosidase/beta-glucuronidase